LLPPIILAVSITATQSGSDYLSSAEVILETVLAGFLATVFLIPIGMMISSLTRRRTYAAVGTFMFVFVLGIVASIFSQFDPNWQLIDPGNVLFYSFDFIFGVSLPQDIDAWLLLGMALLFTVPPMALAYYQVLRKGVGK
jgi:hypothetical protein